MNFLARIMRFVFWVLILSWCLSLLRRLVNWMVAGANRSAEQQGPRANVDGTPEAIVDGESGFPLEPHDVEGLDTLHDEFLSRHG